MRSFDLLAIGGGAGGLAATRTAAALGQSAALVTDAPIGGDCTWTGCVPSKTLIEAAARGASFGEAMGAVRDVVTHIAGTEDADALRAEGVTVIEGRGRLLGGGRVDVGGETLSARRIVVATGASAAIPPIPGLRDVAHLTNETLWDLTAAPRRLAVLGGGPIGCEISQAMARLGVVVTVFEMEQRLLPREEPEASDVVAEALRGDGVETVTGHAVNSVTVGDDGATTVVAGGRRVDVDAVLVAVGRRPNVAGLGLDEAGVEVTSDGHVRVDRHMKTSADGVYAVGDVNGLLPFTNAADLQGRIVARRAARKPVVAFDAGRIPWVTFTDPEVARVGVAEADAPRGARVAYLPMSENDRAIAAGRTAGFVKIIAGPRRLLRNVAGGQILGATIVGARAGEMIHEPALAMTTRVFTGRLALMAHAYPTWSLGVQKCVGQFFQEIEGRRARPVRSPRR